MDKASLVSTILAQLHRDLAVITAEADVSRENATGDEARAEGRYDTRALESSYLAQGQERLAAELREAIGAYQGLGARAFRAEEPVALGALVSVVQAGGSSRYFLGPGGGGQTVALDGGDVLVVTPQSPLGRALLGRRAGDTINGAVPGPLRGAKVERVE